MSKPLKRFLIVDDDPINNLISKSMITHTLGADVHINDFTVPEEGLGFIESEPSHDPPDGKTTVLLDINMPSISGWEFLERFQTFNASTKEQYNIYILSSSIDPNDTLRAQTNPFVLDFIEKPLNPAKLAKIFS
jgi:CheY-like chemotaxis protein